MRITKAMLERQNGFLSERLEKKEQLIVFLKEKIEYLEKMLAGTTSLNIALEKTTEAVAHVVSDLKRRS